MAGDLLSNPVAHDPVDDRTQERARELIGKLDHLAGSSCRSCPTLLCGHVLLTNIALGFEVSPRCMNCLAQGLHQSLTQLCGAAGEYLHARGCFRIAWDYASGREQVSRSAQPECLLTGTIQVPTPQTTGLVLPDAISADAQWDAGHLACGDLVLALRGRMNSLSPGTVLKITALDPAAPEDLPAWCRLTGHQLLHMKHPNYLIQRKDH